MRIEKEDVEKLAHLARLEFTGAELDAMVNDFDKMLGFVQRIQTLDLEGIEPLVYLNEEGQPLREDRPSEPMEPAEALRNSENSDGGYFRVPRVL
ncbi:Asp-tRNA(Asn)/Glu-tRNA(Gln) amidotransferase subunit GatC [bacterium]|nr:Asp-tRNA(Asn)/Glu-tRNA(Gln) amidotransferase subunit GatC [bacterium]